MAIQLAPNWGDAQLEFHLQKMCARWDIDYLALRQGQPCLDFTGEADLDDARNDIAGLIAGLLAAKKNRDDLAARSAFAASILTGKVDPNVIIHRDDNAPSPEGGA